MEFPDGGEFESQIFLSIQAQDFIEDSCRIDEWGILSDS